MLRLLFTLIMLLSACRTTDKPAADPRDVGLLAGASGCDEAVICPMDYAPVHCRLDRGGMPPSFALHVWASNACKGRGDLERQACKAGWTKTERQGITCEPLLAEGVCPAADAVCPPSDKPVAPTLCLAGQYAGKPLPPESEVRGYGAGECAARAAMLAAACRRDLDPRQLQGITCSADPTAGECVAPQDPPDCRETTQRRAACEVTRALGVKLESPITGKGESACAAKRWLVYKACQRGLKPSALEEVVCRFEK